LTPASFLIHLPPLLARSPAFLICALFSLVSRLCPEGVTGGDVVELPSLWA
jgi:hypothetical protein